MREHLLEASVPLHLTCTGSAGEPLTVSCPASRAAISCAGMMRGEVQGTRCHSPATVSYTHLDVYKRQDKDTRFLYSPGMLREHRKLGKGD